MPDDICPILAEEALVVAANDEPIAVVMISASGFVTTQYVAGLDTMAGLRWLERRLEQARRALGAPECRVPGCGPSLVTQASTS